MYIRFQQYQELVSSVEDLVYVDSHSCTNDMGAVEAAAQVASQVSEAFGRLLDCLAEKGILSADDVLRVTATWHKSGDVAAFVEAP